MIVAIHQPNYLPWMGYFHKMDRADVFVFLDDVQFTKGSYINRVKILSSKGPRWLTVPVTVDLGQKIVDVKPSQNNWQFSHIDLLRNEYFKTEYSSTILAELKEYLIAAPKTNIADINISIIKLLASQLDIKTSFINSSNLKVIGKGDERLVNLVKSVSADATYLSGKGGVNYQEPTKFYDAGLGFQYNEFMHPKYDQDVNEFEPGLSVIDCLVRHGWKSTSELIKNNINI